MEEATFTFASAPSHPLTTITIHYSMNCTLSDYSRTMYIIPESIWPFASMRYEMLKAELCLAVDADTSGLAVAVLTFRLPLHL